MDIVSQVTSMVRGAIPRMGQTAFSLSQSKCPVQTGDLLGSLYYTLNSDGFTLGASAPYASLVEEGTPEVNVSGTYVSKVPRHKRTSKNGVRYFVTAHTKTYKNTKPVRLDRGGDDEDGGEGGKSSQIWRTLGNTSGTEGSHFMRRSMEEAIRIGITTGLIQMGAKQR